jgi:Flp pilus assembly protein TadG
MVELALILPILAFMALAIFDFARVYISAVTIESAAREAADYGALYPWHWTALNTSVTEAEMERRACAASSTLTDYDGESDHSSCANPTFTYALVKPGAVSDCSTVPRESTPCRVEVTLTYTFHIIIPLNVQFFDTQLGLPSTVDLVRSSTFAVSDFQLDEPLAPAE